MLALTLVVGCAKESTEALGDVTTEVSTRLEFATNSAVTRHSTSDTTTKWEDGDYIGITDFYTGTAGNYNSCSYLNAKYVAVVNEENNTVKFEYTTQDWETAGDTANHLTEEIKYIEEDRYYIAYYPYRSNYSYDSDEVAAEFNLTKDDINYNADFISDVRDQSDLSKIDFTLAECKPGEVNTSGLYPTVEFNFYHMLTMLRINFTSSEELSNLKLELSGVTTVATYYRGVVSGDYSMAQWWGSDLAESDPYRIGSIEVDLDECEVDESGNYVYSGTAIINPFELADESTLTITDGSKGALYELEDVGDNFTPAENTLITLNISKTEQFTAIEIKEWGEESGVIEDVELMGIAYNSKEDLYEIFTAEGLKTFADMVNEGEASIDGKLTNNIDLTSVCSADLGVNWTPIGCSSSAYKGTFDGDGYEVSGLYMVSSTYPYTGLFGYTNGATISNLGVDGTVSLSTSITTIACTGGIVGYAMNSSIINCYNKATVSGSSSSSGTPYMYSGSGGVVGVSHYATTINGCYNSGEVSGYRSGGIVGYIYDYNSSNINVLNCYNIGGISSNASSYGKAGGIVGDIYVGNVSTTVDISNCYNTGGITSASSLPYLGGIVGMGTEYTKINDETKDRYDEYITISNCYYLTGSADVGYDHEYSSQKMDESTSVADMQSTSFVETLNATSTYFVKDTKSINSGYPILYWQQ